MASHIRVIALLHVIFGGLGVLAGIGFLVFFGGLAGVVGLADHSSDSAVAMPILGGIGGLIFIFALLLSLPSLIAGIGLLQWKPWGRVMTIVLSVIHLMNVPFGTALGVYGLWALLSREGEALFRAPGQMAPVTRY